MFDKRTSVVYQINLRTFTPEGTFKAAQKLLAYLHELGVNVVYLCPFFRADENTDQAFWSKRQKSSGLNNPKNLYRIKDYFAIDEEFGTENDLKDFVNCLHSYGMKVIFDLVYFHCGPNAVFLREHPDFVLRNKDGQPDTGEWNFPKLNFQNAGLRSYLAAHMRRCVSDWGADGFRCDVGDEVPLDFWAENAAALRRRKPDLIMLNEGCKSEYVKEVFDWNYGWICLTGFLKSKDVRALKSGYDNFNSLGHTPFSWIVIFENHDTVNDTERADKVYGFEAVSALFVYIFSLDAIPFLYSGNELCDANTHNLYANRFFADNSIVDWSNALTREGKARLSLIQKLTALRKEEPCIYAGSLEWDDSFAGSGVIIIKRRHRGKTLNSIINFGSRDFECQNKGDAVLEYKAGLSSDNNYVIKPYGYLILKD